MLIAMESSCIAAPRHCASATLPADLLHASIFYQNRHCALAVGEPQHACPRLVIGFDVVLDELLATPLQELTHFLRVRTTRGSKQFKLRHASFPSSLPPHCLQRFTHHMIDGSLHFLDARDVIAGHYDWIFR